MSGTSWMRRRVLPAVAAALVVTGCSGLQLASRPGPLAERFQSELDALHAEFRFPGATAAYVLPDGTVGSAATGLADVETGQRMTVQSRMLAASIGKSFVGAEVVALAQEKKLGLDDPVSKWLGDEPWFSRLPNHDAMTIRHLLHHTAGLIDHVYDEAFAAAIAQRWQEPGNPFPADALIAFALDKEPLNEAGESWEYSDTGYILLGLIIEKAAGRSFYEEVASRFLGPLRLDQTSPSDRRDLPGLAAGYTAKNNALGLPEKTTSRPGVMAWNPAVEWTGGGFISSPRDLARWAKALYEGKAMPGDYLGKLLDSVPIVGFPITLFTGEIRYGAGVGIYEDTRFGPKYGHGGGIPGYVSSMRYYPKHRFAVAFQVNTDIGSDDFAEAMEDRLAMVVAESLKAGQAALERPALTGFPDNQGARQLELEARFAKHIEAANLRSSLKELTAQPRHAGSPGARRLSGELAEKFRSWGFDARIETFYALVSTPKELKVEMLALEPYRVVLAGPAADGLAQGDANNSLPPFNVYSADGDVTAPVVYVNYGLPEDYKWLAGQGIDVRGKIVLSRLGRTFRGVKPRVAAEHGAVGAILYPDPADYGSALGPVYPDGPFLPDDAYQIGSVLDITRASGDPLTTGRAATTAPKTFSPADAERISPVPVLTLSARDVTPILEAMTGPEVPADWRGAQSPNYRAGGNVRVRLTVAQDWKVIPLHNVIATLEGSDWPDEWILRGNNYDAWNHGVCAGSGMIAMLEEARAIGELARGGWRPRRTVMYLAWDGEEQGLLGSTEWVEAHAAELAVKAVAYLNTGINTRGRLVAGGSHALETLVNEVAQHVTDPVTGDSAHQRAAGSVRQEGEEADREYLRQTGRLRLNPLGLGSDFTPFLQHLGIASLDYAFEGDSEGGVYHSRYDGFDFHDRFGDPGYRYGAALAEAGGRTVLRLANAEVLPFDFVGVASAVTLYLAELRREAPGATLDWSALDSAAARLQDSAHRFAIAGERKFPDESETSQLNRMLIASERILAPEHGLSGRPWFRHQLYAPGVVAGYSAYTLPALRSAVEGARWPEAQEEIGKLAGVLADYSAHIDRCVKLLENTPSRSAHAIVPAAARGGLA